MTAAFFNAFTNRDGAADVDCLYELFLSDAIIVNNSGVTPQIFDVAAFVEPRRALLTDGRVTDFREWEVSETTQIFGGIAQRFCCYKKSWVASGNQFSGGGAKSIQFVHTVQGWRIASLVWADEPEEGAVP